MNLDKYLRPIGSPITNRQLLFVGNAYESVYDTRRVKLQTSNSSVKNLVRETSFGTAQGTFGNGASLLITSTLTPDNLAPGAVPLGIPQTSVYQGTAIDEDYQIYPRTGASANETSYIFEWGFDWGSAASDGSDIVAQLAVENIDAGDVTITAVTNWKYIADVNTDTTSGYS